MSTPPADAVVGVAKYEREKEKQKKKTNKKTRNYIAKFTTFLAFFAAGADPGGPAPYPRNRHLNGIPPPAHSSLGVGRRGRNGHLRGGSAGTSPYLMTREPRARNPGGGG